MDYRQGSAGYRQGGAGYRQDRAQAHARTLTREPDCGTRDGGDECSGDKYGADADAARIPSPDQQSKVAVSATYWKPWDDLDIAEWIVLGRRLGAIGRGVAWWIGDWVNYGNAKFGEKYSRAARITGYDVQSLMNMSYVASRFDDSRRRENLSWSHHAELAALPVDSQEMWLENAERDRISVRGLRESVRAWRAAQPGARSRPASDAGRPRPLVVRTDRDPEPGSPRGGSGCVVCPQCGYRMGADGNRC